MNTENKRMWELLPLPKPCDYDPGPEFFNTHFVQPLVADMVQMMCTGIRIDQDAVESLRSTINIVLDDVDAKMLRNPIIQEYQKIRAKEAQKAHFAKATQALRTSDYYLKEYNDTKEHRTWVVNTYLKSIGYEKDVKDAWTVKDLKTYNIFKEDSVIEKILDKSIAKSSPVLLEGMQALADYKAELWNKPRLLRADETASLEPFNIGSAKQLQELFSMLGVEPLVVSEKTGDASWSRDIVEQVLKQYSGDDEHFIEILQCIIEHSFSGIIRNNFLKAFDTFVIDGYLHGNTKLFGAKSFRPTSNTPNMLNFPSTKSKYAKPLKSCFIAPDDMLVYAIDLSALEDRVIANLSGDENKLNIFLEGLDGHSLNACGYFPNEIKTLIGEFSSTVETVKAFMKANDEGDKEIAALRQKSKGPTFKLALTG